MNTSMLYPHDHPHTSHYHGHEHDHDHQHPHVDFGRAFFWGILLNTAFILAEVIYGLSAHSLALLADAGHNASDVLGLGLAWGATLLSRRRPSERFTYGLQSSSIIASLANAVLLLVVTGGIIWEALHRLAAPQESHNLTVMIVAGCGVFVNGITAWLFMAGRKQDLNLRGAYLHMAGDAAVSLGVVIAGAIMLQTGWLWLDPLVSLAIALAIVASAWGLLKDSLKLALQAVPTGINPAEVQQFMAAYPQVREVHDLHIWAMSTTHNALSAHLVMAEGHPGDAFLRRLSHALSEKFSIQHSTLQIELGDTEGACELAAGQSLPSGCSGLEGRLFTNTHPES